MLSKEEIKNKINLNDRTKYAIEKSKNIIKEHKEEKEDCSIEVSLAYDMQYVEEYIDQLESDKQKLIEKLEERIKAVDKCYNELLTDVGGIKIINVTGLTKKEKEEVINKRNCLLVQKHCYVEILSILKGE